MTELKQPHPDDFMVVMIGLEFRAKENPANNYPHPLDSVTSYTVCLPAEDDTADWLEDIAEAIRNRTLYGFMAQEAATNPVACGEWIAKTTEEIIAEASDQ